MKKRERPTLGTSLDQDALFWSTGYSHRDRTKASKATPNHPGTAVLSFCILEKSLKKKKITL